MLDEGREYVDEPADEGRRWCAPVVVRDGGGFLRRSFLGVFLGVGGGMSGVVVVGGERSGRVREGIVPFFRACLGWEAVVNWPSLIMGARFALGAGSWVLLLLLLLLLRILTLLLIGSEDDSGGGCGNRIESDSDSGGI